MALGKYGILMLPVAFLNRATPYIDFTDEAVVQAGGPVVKIIL